MKIPFNKNSEKLMNYWDDSMFDYPTSVKFKLQNLLFNANKIEFNVPKDGFMCSEVIIVALQKSWLNVKTNKLPMSLQLDPILCPPSTIMFALANDAKNFKVIGKLEV